MPAARLQTGPLETWYSFVDYFLDQHRLCRGLIAHFIRPPNSRRRLLSLCDVVTQDPADEARWTNLVTDLRFRYEPYRRIDLVLDAYASTADGRDCVANLCRINSRNESRARRFYLN